MTTEQIVVYVINTTGGAFDFYSDHSASVNKHTYKLSFLRHNSCSLSHKYQKINLFVER